MKRLSRISPDEIRGMSYNALIGLVRETNRPPGGRRTVLEIASKCFLHRNDTVLEVGTSTGFTAIELSRTIDCSITAIDLNETSLAEARRRAKKLGLKRIRFTKADATVRRFPARSFDLVFLGNVVSLVEDKQALLKELLRLLRPNGHLAVCPMYYVANPPEDLLTEIRKAIQVNIGVTKKEDALAPFETEDLDVFYQAHYTFCNTPPSVITNHCAKLLQASHLSALKPATRKELTSTYSSYMQLFGRNLSYMGFTVLILRPVQGFEEAELFRSMPL